MLNLKPHQKSMVYKKLLGVDVPPTAEAIAQFESSRPESIGLTDRLGKMAKTMRGGFAVGGMSNVIQPDTLLGSGVLSLANLSQNPVQTIQPGQQVGNTYKTEEEYQDAWKKLQEQAKKRRQDGFLGQVILPGEGRYEDWKKLQESGSQLIETAKDPRGPYSSALLPYQESTPRPNPNGPMPSDTPSEVPVGAQGAKDLAVKAMANRPEAIQKTEVSNIDPNAAGTNIAAGTGQVTGPAPAGVATTVDTTATAKTPDQLDASTFTATQSAEDVKKAVEGVTGAQGAVSDEAQVTAAQVVPTDTGVGTLTASQGQANMMTNPVQREIEQGELVSGVADAAKAAKFTEQIQAAQATPSAQATVQGQMADLMSTFDAKQPPAWAAGALRSATAQMAARGLSASSMAGQALIQAAMESALPIAQMDAATVSQFEQQNLSNRQQRAMLSAQQRAEFLGLEFNQQFQASVANAAKISDVANMNFTAEQQIALENSRAANSMNLANLSNRQALIMAQAGAISNLEMANLSNQQQAAVQNAQAFLSMDMANLNNQQQAEMFNAQSVIQSIFTDQAADNAAKQFNASSENQTKQFFANLQTQVSQYNASQVNAMNQYNAGQLTAISQFNANMDNQRQQFNAQNALVVAQANAQWRQNTETINTAAQNEANMQFAKDVNDLTNKAIDEIWQRERDIMDYAFTSSEGAKDRALNLLLADKEMDLLQAKIGAEEEAAKTEFWLDLGFKFLEAWN